MTPSIGRYWPRSLRFSLAIVLIGSAAGSPAAMAETVITLGSGFNQPSSVAVDGSGNVFVADTYNNAVKEILAAGHYTTINTLGSGFNSPTGVAVDS
jgi:DNA-binding beta-propeller fold protein YncE